MALLIAESCVQECVLPAGPELAQKRLGRVLDLVLTHFSVPTADESAGAQELDEGE